MVIVQIVARVPAWTPSDAVVYLTGDRQDLGLWKPDAVRMRRQRDGTWATRVRMAPGDVVECKFTLGRWDRVEKDTQGHDIQNRKIRYEGVESILLEVSGWGTQQPRPGTVVGDLHGHERFYSHQLGNVRTIWVWLPIGYQEDASRRYRVLYMQDGQNLFDAAKASFGVEWCMDEAATHLIASRQTDPFIIVGIENSADRFGEYTPTAAGGVGGRGAAYGRFLVNEVKPFIDTHYRTMVGPQGTFIGGSSLGGLISLYLLREYPTVFGGALGVSPSLWWDAENFLRAVEHDARWARGKRVWIDMGTSESGWGDEAGHVARVRRFRDALVKMGLKDEKDVKCLIDEGATHDEASWARRAPAMLAWLLG